MYPIQSSHVRPDPHWPLSSALFSFLLYYYAHTNGHDIIWHEWFHAFLLLLTLGYFCMPFPSMMNVYIWLSLCSWGRDDRVNASLFSSLLDGMEWHERTINTRWFFCSMSDRMGLYCVMLDCIGLLDMSWFDADARMAPVSIWHGHYGMRDMRNALL